MMGNLASREPELPEEGDPMRVLLQLRASRDLTEAADAGLAIEAMPASPEQLVPGFELDQSFSGVKIPTPVPAQPGGNPYILSQPLSFSEEEATVVVRGEVDDSVVKAAEAIHAGRHPDVVAVFADPTIERCPTCGGDDAVGDAETVADLLGCQELQAGGFDGSGVALAIVDTGINLDYFDKHEFDRPVLDAERSFTPSGVNEAPGEHPVAHGTMCAFDSLIAASKATLLDCAVLLSKRQGTTVMEGLLSDAILAYAHLRSVLSNMATSDRALVVSNSWGMFTPQWDLPVGSPGNYSDNPAHPFNVIVSSLEAAGADILFAAGNCGTACPDGRCGFAGDRPICGANSHPKVLAIGGVDTEKEWVGYSSEGPGRLMARKPDVCSYTHFAGSGVEEIDTGTSAACPVAAGVIAAIRTRFSTEDLSPAALRSLVQKTADDRGPVGFDYQYGWGILDPTGLAAALVPATKAPSRRAKR
jgi:subtilisin family serine protease